jgi:hypothetical protein
MSQEELLLEQWRYLPPQDQTAVINFAEFLRHKRSMELQEDIDYDAPEHLPEHLKVRSIEHLHQLLQEGLDSLDRGEGIEATDDWWEKEREQLLAKGNA